MAAPYTLTDFRAVTHDRPRGCQVVSSLCPRLRIDHALDLATTCWKCDAMVLLFEPLNSFQTRPWVLSSMYSRSSLSLFKFCTVFRMALASATTLGRRGTLNANHRQRASSVSLRALTSDAALADSSSRLASHSFGK